MPYRELHPAIKREGCRDKQLRVEFGWVHFWRARPQATALVNENATANEFAFPNYALHTVPSGSWVIIMPDSRKQKETKCHLLPRQTYWWYLLCQREETHSIPNFRFYLAHVAFKAVRFNICRKLEMFVNVRMEGCQKYAHTDLLWGFEHRQPLL